MGGGGGAPQGEDFWSELSSTNALLSQLQEQIQAVRSAHQQSLVSRRRQPDADMGEPVGGCAVRYTDIHCALVVDRPSGRGVRRPAKRPGPHAARAVQEQH
jgi:hypothetical protein